ncbi:MAG: CoA-binding protein [Actinomycetota bacterium]|nr:CoA-binding protein [Actinomycetota bacterium]
MSSTDQCTPSRGRPGLAIAAALVAVSAYAGCVGLAGGGLSLGADVDARLPWHSPVVGGVALALLVAVPFTMLAKWAWAGDRRTNLASVLFGAALIAWLLVELAFIREFSFFHPLYTAIGIAFIVAGSRPQPRPVDLATVQHFLAHQRIALVGASADRRKFGNVVFKALRDHGHEVVPVNTGSADVEGVPCVRSVADIEGEIDAAMVMLPGDAAADAVRACVDRGIHHVWLFRGAGTGAVSEAAIAAGEAPGVSLVPGACPLMFLEPVASFHKVHLATRRFTGALAER